MTMDQFAEMLLGIVIAHYSINLILPLSEVFPSLLDCLFTVGSFIMVFSVVSKVGLNE